MKKVKLGALGDVFIGLTYKPEDVCEEGTIVLRSSNVQNARLDFNDIVRVKCEVKDKLFVRDGDILMCSRNGSANLVGKSALISELPERMTFGAFMTIIRTNENSYLQYFFRSPFFKRQLKSSATTTINQITRNMLVDVEVPLLDENESKIIVGQLSKVELLIKMKQQELELLDNLIKSRFVEMFGDIRANKMNWYMTSLKSVAEVRGRVGWKGYKKDDLRESGPLVLGATHLTESGCIDLSSPVYLSREKYEESPEIMLQKHDLIFTQRGNTIGKVGLIENDIGEATINPCVLILRPLAINPVYFKTYFIMNETKSDMWSLNAGSAQPMITQKGIGEYMLMLPPMELQNQFADFVHQVDKLKFEVQKSLDETQILMDSLMQQYFG